MVVLIVFSAVSVIIKEMDLVLEDIYGILVGMLVVGMTVKIGDVLMVTLVKMGLHGNQILHFFQVIMI